MKGDELILTGLCYASNTRSSPSSGVILLAYILLFENNYIFGTTANYKYKLLIFQFLHKNYIYKPFEDYLYRKSKSYWLILYAQKQLVQVPIFKSRYHYLRYIYVVFMILGEFLSAE